MARTFGRTTQVGLSLVAVATALVPAACTGAGAGEEEEEVALVQTKLKELKGYPGHHIVTFTKTGVERADVSTTPVSQGKGQSELPYAALLYNADGSTFVYTATGPRTYRYTPIDLKKIVGETIYFTGGPKPGTPVVTSGVPQVHGADIELEFGEIA